jgi:hypothetical protein
MAALASLAIVVGCKSFASAAFMPSFCSKPSGGILRLQTAYSVFIHRTLFVEWWPWVAFFSLVLQQRALVRHPRSTWGEAEANKPH